MQEPLFALRNGQSLENDVCVDRGLAFADGVFETLLWSGGAFPLIDFHARRLQQSCLRLGIPIDPSFMQGVFAQLQSLLAKESMARVKIIVTRAENEGNYTRKNRSQEEGAPNLWLMAYPLDHIRQDPRHLVVSDHTLIEHPKLVGIKHLNRMNYTLACLGQYFAPDQEVLFTDTRGNLVETMHHNVFGVLGSQIVTPRLKCAGVEGVMKAYLTSQIDSLTDGGSVVEKDLRIEDLEKCEGVFLTNAISGIVPVLSINRKLFSRPGLDRVLALQAALNGALNL